MSKHLGVVIDKSYWEAVRELPIEKAMECYLFDSVPLYQLITEEKTEYEKKGLLKIE